MTESQLVIIKQTLSIELTEQHQWSDIAVIRDSEIDSQADRFWYEDSQSQLSEIVYLSDQHRSLSV